MADSLSQPRPGSPRAADAVGRVLSGRYRLTARLGSGSSAQVYAADDIELRRQVAVKVLHPALADDQVFLKRFRAEAQAAAGLSNPYIMSVYDWGHDDGPYLVTEYLGGGSLRSMLDAGNRLSPSQALVVGLDAVRGLEYAHRRGLVHRDIKPGNLIFDDEGRLKIADFGLARALAEAGWTEPQGAVVGTARYASPEQAQGQSLSGKSDVYALALTLVEAVTGSVPFSADTQLGTLMARVDNDLDVPGALEELRPPLERAGLADPDERPDAGEFGVALMASAEALPRPKPLPLVGARLVDPDTSSPPTALAPAVSVAPARAESELFADDDADPPARRWLWALFFVALVAGAGVGGWFLVQANAVESHAVPDVVGLTQDEALAAVAPFEWNVDANLRDRSDAVAQGSVVRIDPPEGTELAEGEDLRMWISLGPTTVSLRGLGDVANVTPDELEQRLNAVDLVLGDATTAFDEVVVEGQVVRLDLAEPDPPKGSAVDYVVSDGPAPRIVPVDGFVGLDCDEASVLLERLRLVPVCEDVFDPEIEEGLVVGLDPIGGTSVAADSTVTISISEGPEPVPFPSLIGLTVDAAEELLTDQGFCIDDVDGPPNGQVTGQDLLPDDLVVPGTCVNLTTREEPATTTTAEP